MPAEISLRPAFPEDEDWLLDLRRRTIVPYRAAMGLPINDASLYETVRDHFDDAQIVCDSDRPIGLFKAYREGDAWILSQIQMEPSTQSRGIGASLRQKPRRTAYRSG